MKCEGKLDSYLGGKWFSDQMSSKRIMAEYQTYFKYICFGEKAVFSNGLAAPVYSLTVGKSVSGKVRESCMQCVSELRLSLY